MLLFVVTRVAYAHGPDIVVPAPFPSTLSVLAHGKANELLGPGWTDTAVISAKAPVGTGSLQMAVGGMGYLDTGITISGPHNLTYPVFKTNIKNIGVAVGEGYSLNGGSWHWRAGHSLSKGDQVIIPAKAGDLTKLQFYGAMVRLGDVQKGGVVQLRVLADGSYNKSMDTGGTDYLADYFFSDLSTITANVVSQTCKISPIPSVSLGDVPPTLFKRVGAKSNPVQFGASITCPSGFTKVFYQINPAGGSAIVGDSKDGNISLSGGGASGVAVHIESDTPNQPVPLGQNVPVTQYDPGKDNQQIELGFNACLLQTDSQIHAGEAEAKAVITLSYQ
ncbi:fimbrial protein (plasmid) [Burkholderia pyrrocinia]|uniref:fimbrial protein n=1 Tax=Burkholderia pyrrocinia TaxID=60550 RepID=UPI0038B579C4